MVEAATAALVGALAFDVGVYAVAAREAKGDLERMAEPVAALSTAVALGFVLALSGRPAGALLLTVLIARAGWDALHLGGGNVLAADLPRDYPLYAMVAKAAAAALYLAFALPA